MGNKPSPVIHFEIGCQNLEKTRSFYSEIFDWEMSSNPHSEAYDISTGPNGITGHIVALGHEPHNYTNFYILVDNVEDYLAKVEARGGSKLLGPIPLPDGEQFAWFSDPDGNTIGLLQVAANES